MAGRGTLRERSDHKWELTVALGIGPNGKQIRKYRTVEAKTKKEAERLLAKFVTELETGLVGENERITLDKFIELWFESYAKPNLAPKSLARYEQLAARIKKALGSIQLGKLRADHLLKFYANLAEPGIREDDKTKEPQERKALSERTILHHHRLLHTILETAVRWQYITSNPASRVKPPKVPDSQAICYDEDQVSALLTALKRETLVYQVAVWLTLAAGLRQGELMGLRWKDVDLSKGTIMINQVRQYASRQTVVKEPKTIKSRRIIAIPAMVVQMLKKFKAQQAANKLRLSNKYNDSGYVIARTDGTEMYPNAMSNWFPEFLERHNLPHMNFHGLRHTSATMLIGDGFNVVDISRRLGHARTSTTLDIYSHSFMKADEQAATTMNALLKKASKKKAQKKG